jgi:hypothetical protein
VEPKRRKEKKGVKGGKKGKEKYQIREKIIQKKIC